METQLLLQVLRYLNITSIYGFAAIQEGVPHKEVLAGVEHLYAEGFVL